MLGAIDNKTIISSEEGNKCEDKSTSHMAEDKTGCDKQESSTPALNQVNYDLNKFRLKCILNNNTRNKSISLLGHFPDLSDSDMAIIIFEKDAFRESDVATNEISDKIENGKNEHVYENEQKVEERLIKPSYFCKELKVQTEFINNIYGSYQCTPPAILSGVKATVVYPATDKHIEKYSISEKFLVNETPELYREVTLPYITSSQFSLEWVYNILEHKKESERIIFEDSDPEKGFILLPDLKWDGRNVENLYLLALTHKRNIKSLRDLNISHLPLLRSIRHLAAEAIQVSYGIPSTQLRMYIHYQPSFYHLHIHINSIRNDAPGISCEKSHLIDTVINNLELLPDYYEKATLSFVLHDGNKLLKLYEDKLPLRKTIKRSPEIDSDMENISEQKKEKFSAVPCDEGNNKTVVVTN